MTRVMRLLLLGGLGLGCAGMVYAMVAREPAATQQTQARRTRAGDGPIPISAIAAVRADVPVYLDGVGTASATKTVTVRPQIEGKLTKVLFKEGQDVKAGDVLATIDPVTYKARLDQVFAKKAQDEALLAAAKLDLERYSRVTTGYIAQKQIDTQRSLVAQYTAQLKGDDAAIDDARNNLEYTTIRAPIDGRTGIRQVDEGNIVQAASTSPIVVITQVRPIAVVFALPQQHLRAVNLALTKGALAVEVMEADNATILDRGMLQVVDNQVDQTTGTVRLKAEFPNDKLQVWPGQFVNVRLLIETLPQVVTAPTAAVQRGPKGTFVYVVAADDSVNVRAVTVGQQEERRSVILAGLEAGDRVAINGFQRLTEGARVVVTAGETETAPQAPVAPAANQQRRQRNENVPPGERQKRGDQGERQNRNRPPTAPANPTQ